MSDARAELLARVRAALATARLPEPEAAERRPRPGAPGGEEGLREAFSREAVAVGCRVHGPLPASEALPLVSGLLRERNARRLLAWDDAELPAPGLRAGLLGLGFAILDPSLPADRAGRAERLRQLDAAEVGLTGALAGLADTGSLVLASGPGRPRLAALLPPVHVALLPVDRLRPDLASFLDGAGPLALSAANITLVTGPSRTGDIELILTRGVHGPGEVHVVLIG